MKLSLIGITSLSLSLLGAACGNSDDNDKLHGAPTPVGTPAAAPAPAATGQRKLVEGTALPTSPVNLIADPGFALTGQEAGFGSFLAFDAESFSQLTLATTVDSRSPAGFGGSVALVKPDGGTNKVSAPVMLLTSFQGGAGPFHARVWVSKSELSGKPTELTFDEKGIRASVTDETPDGAAFDLTPVSGAERVIGGRTWTLLRGEITKPLTYGGFFVVRTGTSGGQFHVAAPEIVAQPLIDGLAATRSLSPSLRARAKTTTERGAILRYKARPPLLVPAGSPALRP